MTPNPRLEAMRAAWPSVALVRESVLGDAGVRGAGRRGATWSLATLAITALWVLPLVTVGDVPLRTWYAQLFGVLYTVIAFILMTLGAVCAALTWWEFHYARHFDSAPKPR